MADPTVRTHRWPTVFVAALGLALSIWLEVVHYRAYTAPLSSTFCSVGERLDCASVALSALLDAPRRAHADMGK